MWTGEAVPQKLSKIKVMLCKMLVRCKKSVAYATEILQIFKKIEQMNSFAVFKSRTEYTDSLSIDNCDVHRWAT